MHLRDHELLPAQQAAVQNLTQRVARLEEAERHRQEAQTELSRLEREHQNLEDSFARLTGADFDPADSDLMTDTIYDLNELQIEIRDARLKLAQYPNRQRELDEARAELDRAKGVLVKLQGFGDLTHSPFQALADAVRR